MIGYAGYAAANEGNVTGIENILGNVGLTYLFNAIPTQNAIHDTLAVKFYPPQTTSYAVTDIGILNAMSPNSGGFFIINNTAKPLWAKVKNTGNQQLANCSAFVRVRNSSNAIVHSSAVAIGSMTPSQVESVAFTSWIPNANGLYRTVFRAKTAGDMFPPNDSVVIETRVVTYPGELYYDDGTTDNGISWQGSAGGMGVKFTPPLYPCRITSARAYLYYQTAPLTCTLWVLKADGPNGTPGSVLGRGNINVNVASPGTWYSISLDATIDAGSFFVGVTSNGTSDPIYCLDTSFPISHQTWEYTNGWAPYRSTNEDDALMRATVQLGSAIEELGPTQITTLPSFSVFPNPFVNQAKIQFNGAVSKFKTIEIYNATGERVSKLSTDKDFILWNGYDYLGNKLSRGIYFAKLKNEDAPVVKVLLLD